MGRHKKAGILYPAQTWRGKIVRAIKVLSLFDGMSCGQIALDRVGIKVGSYYASEIDKYAIKVALANYPETIQVGDVAQLRAGDLPKIDLLIGGSPCQGFSFAGKQLNFNDPRSKLFFEYGRLLREVRPEYFLLENVRMKRRVKRNSLINQIFNGFLYSAIIIFAVWFYLSDNERSGDCAAIKGGMWNALYQEEHITFFAERYCVGLMFKRDRPRIPPQYLVFKMRRMPIDRVR